jgi:hypothetical protein
MKNFFTITILSFLLLVCITSFSYSKEQPKGITLIKENDGYKVEYTLPDYYMNDIFASGNNYMNLGVPEYGQPTDIGRPNLPQLSFGIMIAYGEQNPTINVLNQVQDLRILNSKIYPVQQPWSKNLRLEDRPFTIDSKYYQSTGNINGPFIKISEPFIIAGVKGVIITVCPFAYNPSTNQLMVTKKGSFKIQLKSEPAMSFAPSKSFNEFYDAMFLNYVPSKATGTGRYLIITAPEFESGLTPLVNEKTGLGYIVSVVNTGVTGTTNAAIKTYLQNLYNNTSTRPEFVLLVGDVDKIPEWVGTGEGTPHTDLNYSCLEGSDPFADVFLGRFPIQNTTQLSNMITKTLYMENAINSLPKKNVFCASSDNWAITEGTHNFCIDSFFVPSVYTNIKLYCHTYSATTQQLSDALNANQTFAIYSGHGSETSWADGPPLNQSQVNALTNTVFPYTYAFSCLTGSYYISTECFSETWVRGQKGAVVYWGSSVESYWDEDDILQKRTFRAVFVENLKKTSPSFVLGKYLLAQYYGSITPTVQRYMEMYNCMGDPSIYMKAYGPAIAHTPLPNTENLTGPYVVNCIVTSEGLPIIPAQTKLFWTRGTTFTDSIVMTNTSGNNYTTNIPGNGSQANYRYYIKAMDNGGFIGTAPSGAPVNYYSFTAGADTVKPVIVHTQIPPTPKSYWPISVSASVTDNIGLDSVWVEWFKNTPSPIKEFKLTLSSGNIFSAIFNSINSDVVVGDQIYYVIKAKDNSANHNTTQLPATGYYSFPIITLKLCEGYTNTTFPPSGWTITGTSSSYWTRNDVSSYGLGTGSARFNFYSVSSGSATLTTLTFDPTIATDSLKIDKAHAYYSSSYIDSLRIEASTDGGSTYSLITVLYSTTNFSAPYALSTVSSTSLFVPTSSQWNTRAFGLPVGTNKIRFNAISGYGNDLFLDSIRVVSAFSGIHNIGLELPNVYQLYQNYPNPFNPVTKINFDIPKQGLVTMKVYDVLGREVRTLINEVKSPGKYSIDFNGMELSSGVYFYRLESNGFTDIKRMVLIK